MDAVLGTASDAPVFGAAVRAGPRGRRTDELFIFFDGASERWVLDSRAGLDAFRATGMARPEFLGECYTFSWYESDEWQLRAKNPQGDASLNACGRKKTKGRGFRLQRVATSTEGRLFWKIWVSFSRIFVWISWLVGVCKREFPLCRVKRAGRHCFQIFS